MLGHYQDRQLVLEKHTPETDSRAQFQAWQNLN